MIQVAEIERLGADFKAPGGESQREVEQRMIEFIRQELLNSPTRANATAASAAQGRSPEFVSALAPW